MKYFDKDGLNLFFVDNATEPINVFLVKSRQNRYCLTAIMTDTINSEKSATAWYGDIWFTKKRIINLYHRISGKHFGCHSNIKKLKLTVILSISVLQVAS